jgi:hypothetical protein
MERVTGIGGVFFRSSAPEQLAVWYQQHLGVPSGLEGGHDLAARSRSHGLGAVPAGH